MATSKKAAKQDQLRVNEKKWSPEVMEAGFTVLPNILFERQKKLGLSAVDINILCFLSTFWWDADGHARPGKQTIGDAIGLHPSNVRKRIARMEKAGFLKRIPRTNYLRGSDPNAYDLTPLREILKPYAAEKVAERKAMADAKAAKVSSMKGPQAPTLVVNNDDD